MSVQIRIGGQALVLPYETTATLHLRPGFVDTDIIEPFSLPFTIPRDGNEHIIGHLNRADLAAHKNEFQNAELLYNGILVHAGKVTILDALPEEYEASFSDTGLSAAANSTTLQDMDHGAPVDATGGMRAHAAAVNNLTWPEADYCFPMMHCPDLLPDNPQWNPPATEYNDSTDYVYGNRVTYAFSDALHDVRTYLSLNGSAGQSPENTPTVWEPITPGILNRWAHWVGAGAFPANGPSAQWVEETGETTDPGAPTLGSNYFAMAAMPYWKYVLKAIARHWGLRAVGTWMEDPAYHRMAMFSNHLLDATPWNYFWRAAQVGTTYTSGGSPNSADIPLHNDSTDGNEDADGQWNTSSMLWTCPQTGWYLFKMNVGSRANNGTSPANQYGLRVALMKSGGPPSEVAFHIIPGYATGSDHEVILWHEMDSGDVGSTFFFRVTVIDTGMTDPVLLRGYTIQGTRSNISTLVNSFATEVDRSKIVPDITIAQFLVALRDRFGVSISLDMIARTLRIDHSTTVLEEAPLDVSSLVRGPVQLEFTGDRTDGLELNEGGDEEFADMTGFDYIGYVDNELNIGLPTNPGHAVIVRNTRRVFIAKLKYGWRLEWEFAGYYKSTVRTGAGPDRVTITPDFTLPGMAFVQNGGSEFLVPKVSVKGNSLWWGTAHTKCPLLAFVYHGMIENVDGHSYPFASPYRWGPQGEDLESVDLSWEDANSPYHRNWSHIARAFSNPLKARVSLQLTPDFVLQHRERRIWMIDHQTYLPVNIPVTYRSNSVMAIDCELIKWTPNT